MVDKKTADFEEREWYTISNADQLDSPALVFYPDRIAENIRRLIAGIDKIDRLRTHVKTHKSADVTRMLLDAGITKYKCATIAEAEMLGSCMAPDVLLAYQLVGPKIQRFIRLIVSFPNTSFSCLLDNKQSAISLSAAATEAGLEIPVFVDLNVGMGRTGVAPDERAIVLYREICGLGGLKLNGFHAYDGHIHVADLQLRQQQWEPVWESIVTLKEQLIAEGYPEPVIVAGGTPTFPFYARQRDVECSPGTFILWDKGYQDAFKEQHYLPAAVVLSRVISKTGDDKISVDLGHKSVAAENILARRVSFLNAPEGEMVGQSEEHLVVKLGKDHGFAIGDLLYGLPIHICPTVALYERAATVYAHKVVGEWKIDSRDRKITI